MVKLARPVDMYPLGEEAEDGYTVLCIDTEGDYHHIDFETFEDAYSFKDFLTDMPFGTFYETELVEDDVTEVFSELMEEE